MKQAEFPSTSTFIVPEACKKLHEAYANARKDSHARPEKWIPIQVIDPKNPRKIREKNPNFKAQETVWLKAVEAKEAAWKSYDDCKKNQAV